MLQTDKSFEGAVNAQLKKQTRGIDYLEKRLLKAQKKKLSDHYLEMGENMIPSLIKCLDPLNPNFTLIEY